MHVVHATLQKALKQAVRDDLVPRNVAEGEKTRSSRRKKEAKALSPTRVRALLSAARGTRYEALYVAAVHTGLRQGELLGLRWSDVELEAGKLSVRRSLKVTEDGLAFGLPKNKASLRSVPLNQTTVAALRAHSYGRTKRGYAPPSGTITTSCSPTGLVGPQTTTTSTIGSTSRSSNVPGSRTRVSHSTRYRTPSSQRPCLREATPEGGPVASRHSSITQTMVTYSHLMDGIGGDAVKVLDEAFG